MNACTLLSNFTREEYKGGSEPGLVLGGGWHLLFFCHWTGRRDKKPLLSSWTTRATPHSSSPGSRATPPHQRAPSSESPIPAPLLSSRHPLYQGHNDFIFHKQWTILQGCHRLTELYLMWFYLLFLSSDTSLFLMIYIHLYKVDSIAKTCMW